MRRGFREGREESVKIDGGERIIKEHVDLLNQRANNGRPLARFGHLPYYTIMETFPTLTDLLYNHAMLCSCGGLLSVRSNDTDPLALLLSHARNGEKSSIVISGENVDEVRLDACIRRSLKRWHFWQSEAGQREAARLDL